ncbi:MAG: hypothetical protein AB8B62_10400 [Roseobacter sp.]
MMRSVGVALILAIASAPAAQAGAWLREKGKGFLATSFQTTRNNGNEISIYAEYGLSDRITLGLDSTYDTDLLNYVQGTGPMVSSLEELPQGSGVVFMRFPLGPTDGIHKWAFHVGAGARYIEGEFLKAAELGLSWGRGIQLGDRYGWVNVDSSINAAESPGETRTKLDGTVGLGITPKTKVMLQMFNTFVAAASYNKIAPSLLYAPGKGKLTFQIGSEYLLNGGDASLKVGLWLNF